MARRHDSSTYLPVSSEGCRSSDQRGRETDVKQYSYLNETRRRSSFYSCYSDSFPYPTFVFYPDDRGLKSVVGTATGTEVLRLTTGEGAHTGEGVPSFYLPTPREDPTPVHKDLWLSGRPIY